MKVKKLMSVLIMTLLLMGILGVSAAYAETPGTVTLAYPNNEELFITGRSYILQWSHTGTPGVNLGTGVKVDLYKGGVFNSTISSNVNYGSNGSTRFYWAPPATLSGSDFQIKVTDVTYGNISDLSNSYFTIGTNNAAYVSDTIPTVMETNKQYNVSVTFQNTGTSTWSATNSYMLGAKTLSDPFTSSTKSVAPDVVAPGQTKTFTFTMTAPVYAGVYQTSWVMMQQGVSFGFGDVLTKNVTVDYGPGGLNTPPEVTTSDPVNKATTVPLNKVITLTFNENIKPGSDFANISLKTVHDVPVPAVCSIAGNKLIITPSSSLADNKAYYVSMTANAVYDMTDFAMKSPYTLYFDTLAPGAPRIVITNPANGSRVNGVVSGITATFVDEVGVMDLFIDNVLVESTAFPLFEKKQNKDHMTYAYKWDTSSLADGSVHSISVKTYGTTGNIGTSYVTIDKSIDIIAPTISISTPVNGATLPTEGNNLRITAAASDNVGVTKIEFYVDNVKVGEGTPSNPYVDWRSTVGYHNLTAKAYDARGNSTTSAINTVYVPAVVTITNPVNNSTVSGVINTFSATFSSPNNSSWAALYIDGVRVASVFDSDTQISFYYNWDTTKLVEGSTHTIEIVGNCSFAESRGKSIVTVKNNI